MEQGGELCKEVKIVRELKSVGVIRQTTSGRHKAADL